MKDNGISRSAIRRSRRGRNGETKASSCHIKKGKARMSPPASESLIRAKKASEGARNTSSVPDGRRVRRCSSAGSLKTYAATLAAANNASDQRIRLRSSASRWVSAWNSTADSAGSAGTASLPLAHVPKRQLKQDDERQRHHHLADRVRRRQDGADDEGKEIGHLAQAHQPRDGDHLQAHQDSQHDGQLEHDPKRDGHGNEKAQEPSYGDDRLDGLATEPQEKPQRHRVDGQVTKGDAQDKQAERCRQVAPQQPLLVGEQRRQEKTPRLQDDDRRRQGGPDQQGHL